MLPLRQNTYYRIYRSDHTTVDFQTLNKVPEAKLLTEVKTKANDRMLLSELLAEQDWKEIAEIDKSIADM